MRIKGKITAWNDEKGYGFIEPLDGGRRVFVHIKAFANRGRRPAVNQLVSYALSADGQGRPCAAKATLAGGRLPWQAGRAGAQLALLGATVFLAAVGVAVVTSEVPPALLGLYVIASLITYAVYAMDKSAARNGAWRTKESRLHMLALIGGWPGALVAQQRLRHKSRKRSFRAVFWLTVLLNCAAFAWTLTPGGAATVRSLFDAMR